MPALGQAEAKDKKDGRHSEGSWGNKDAAQRQIVHAAWVQRKKQGGMKNVAGMRGCSEQLSTDLCVSV